MKHIVYLVCELSFGVFVLSTVSTSPDGVLKRASVLIVSYRSVACFENHALQMGVVIVVVILKLPQCSAVGRCCCRRNQQYCQTYRRPTQNKDSIASFYSEQEISTRVTHASLITSQLPKVWHSLL